MHHRAPLQALVWLYKLVAVLGSWGKRLLRCKDVPFEFPGTFTQLPRAPSLRVAFSWLVRALANHSPRAPGHHQRGLGCGEAWLRHEGSHAAWPLPAPSTWRHPSSPPPPQERSGFCPLTALENCWPKPGPNYLLFCLELP